MPLASTPGVVDVVELFGARCPPGAAPRLLVEVPHGADRAAHYRALAARLHGRFPAGLIDFFHANTDEGAWDLGLAAARAFLELRPEQSVRLLRCLVPRTFIDCNRVLEGDVTAHGGGVTAGLPVYVDDARDQALLRELHRQYCALVDAAVEETVAADGLVLVPHTYAPRTVGIAAVEWDIVEKMHWAWHPERVAEWPLRPEVDLITKDGEGRRRCPEGMVERVVPGLQAIGLTAEEGGTYWLHPATRAAELSARFPGRLFCLELRRDLVMRDWQPFVECSADPACVEAVGGVLGRALADQLPVGA